jgi:hypothetical protein
MKKLLNIKILVLYIFSYIFFAGTEIFPVEMGKVYVCGLVAAALAGKQQAA